MMDGPWLEAYAQMVRIRIFEEHVNALYRSAKMSGLAHLYIGEEAVAVGVCLPRPYCSAGIPDGGSTSGRLRGSHWRNPGR